MKKTAALSVAKIYQITPSHTKEYGFIKLLQGLLQDGNAIVVANAAAALYEISKEAGKNYIKANKETIGKLLNALNETNEWGQVYILESIINYKPKEDKEAEEIIERIMPRLQHANPAVVLGATKNILHFLDFIDDSTNKSNLTKKLSAPLITLLSSEPEIQYVSLCNILNILEQIPNVFEKNVKMFFCRFSDPIYVKLTKVDVLVSVADSTNIDIIVAELHEYCNDMDEDFVRRAVRAIGQVVCKVERVAKKGVEALREHINHEGGSESALQEAVVVSSKIFRKYPKKFESLLKDICAQMKRISEPESKAAFIWMLGEFAEKIENVEDMLQYFVDSFADEASHVCLQILTAAVKMYIKKPDDCEEMVMNVLHLASEVSANPDLRDRGYIYWRMLSTDPTATKDVVLIQRPAYTDNLGNLLDEETREIFTDTGIVKKKQKQEAPEKKIELSDDEEAEGEPEPEVEEEPKSKKKDKKKKKTKKPKEEEVEKEPEETVPNSKPAGGLDDLLGLDFGGEPTSQEAPASSGADPLADIFGGGSASNGVHENTSSSNTGWADNDIFGGGSGGASHGNEADVFIKPDHTEVLSASTSGQSGNVSGLKIKGRFYQESSDIKLQLNIHNGTSKTASDFEILFNKNSFGLTAGSINVIPLSAGQEFTTTVTCTINNENADMKNPPSCPYMIQTAMKCSLDVFYFQIPCLLHVLLSATPVNVTQAQCQQMANSISAKNSKTVTSARFANSVDDLKTRLKANSMYFIYEDGGSLVFATSTINNIPILLRININGSKITAEE